VKPIFLFQYHTLLDRLQAAHYFQRQFGKHGVDVQIRRIDGSIEVTVTSGGQDVIAMVRLQPAPNRYNGDYGKMFLFRVLSFHKSHDSTTIQTLEKLHRVYLVLNKNHQDIFQMEILEDTSKDLMFTQQDEPFLQEFGDLDHLHVVYWVARGKTAVQEVDDFMPLDMRIDGKKTMATAQNRFHTFQKTPAGGFNVAQQVFTALKLITMDIATLKDELNRAKALKNKDKEIIKQKQEFVYAANREWFTVTNKRVCQELYDRIQKIKSLPQNQWDSVRQEMGWYRQALKFYNDMFVHNIYFQLVTGNIKFCGKTIPLHIVLRKTDAVKKNQQDDISDYKKDRKQYLKLLNDSVKGINMDMAVHFMMNKIIDFDLTNEQIRQVFGHTYHPDNFDFRKYQSAWWEECVLKLTIFMKRFCDDYKKKVFDPELFKSCVLAKIKHVYVMPLPAPLPKAPLPNPLPGPSQHSGMYKGYKGQPSKYVTQRKRDRRSPRGQEERYNPDVYKEFEKFYKFMMFKKEYGPDRVTGNDYIDRVTQEKKLSSELLDIIYFSRNLRAYQKLLRKQDTDSDFKTIWGRFKEWINNESRNSNSGSDESIAVYNARNDKHKLQEALIKYRLQVHARFARKIMDLMFDPHEDDVTETNKNYFNKHIRPEIASWFHHYFTTGDPLRGFNSARVNNESSFKYVDEQRFGGKEDFEDLIRPFLQFCKLGNWFSIEEDYITVVEQSKTISRRLTDLLEDNPEEEDLDDESVGGSSMRQPRRKTMRRRR